MPGGNIQLDAAAKPFLKLTRDQPLLHLAAPGVIDGLSRFEVAKKSFSNLGLFQHVAV